MQEQLLPHRAEEADADLDQPNTSDTMIHVSPVLEFSRLLSELHPTNTQ